MSKDAEGNGFSPLAECGVGIYVPYTGWYGEVYGEDEWGGDEEIGQRALVLWPVN